MLQALLLGALTQLRNQLGLHFAAL